MSLGGELWALLARGRPLSAGVERAEPMRRAARGAALVALVCVLVLAVDHAIAVVRAPGETIRIRRLEEQTKEDPAAAAELHRERERQTQVSLARQARGRIAAWLLLVSAGVFVACGKWSVALSPRRSPSLDEVVVVRLGLTAAGRDPLAGAPPAKRPAGDGLDLSFVEALLARLGPSREAAIPILQAIQDHYRYLPDAALARVCERTEITPAQIAGTSSFYAQFRRSPVGLYVARVCHGTACHVAGAEQITQELRRHLGVAPGADTDPDGRFTLDIVACVGCCSLAPVMMVGEQTAGRLTPASARQALAALGARA